MRVFSSVPRDECLGGMCNTGIGQSLMVSSVGYFKDVLSNVLNITGCGLECLCDYGQRQSGHYT